MFPLGLAAFIDPHWATMADGACLEFASEFVLFTPGFTSARERCAETLERLYLVAHAPHQRQILCWKNLPA
jgi:hypothetical protein